MSDPVISLFRVEYTIPPDEKYRYIQNRQSSVLTTDVNRAIEVVMAKFDTATIHAVHRLSSRNDLIIIDPTISEYVS